MIVDLDKTNVSCIKNSRFRAYAGLYDRIYDQFLAQIGRFGLEFAARDGAIEGKETCERLREQGAVFRNQGKSIYTNRISPACEACQTGLGSATFFISLRCCRSCYYCFNPNQERYDYYLQHERDASQELEQIYAAGKKIKQIALTGGEPLIHKDQAAAFFQTAHKRFPHAYTRLYTCGDTVDEAILQRLKDAGLDEIRFSIRMYDLEKGHREVFAKIALAKQYIPCVMVEMPVLPDTFAAMKEVLLELERLEIFGINLLEFCFPFHNAEIFRQKGYRIKPRPYRVLYDYWYAGGLPVAGSEEVCLDLLSFALDQGLKIGVHYCSLENKHTGQIYQQNAGRQIPKTAFFSKKDYFLKSAKVFGEDVPQVLSVFRKHGYRDYTVNEAYDFVEFHVSKIKLLKHLPLEVGISTGVIENRNGESFVRELKVDLTTPQSFDWMMDV